MRIYGDLVSGNCLKVKWTCDHLRLAYEWVDIDIMQSESRTPVFLAKNPFGQVPVVAFDDGRHLAQSNAIVLYLADGSDLVPADPFVRAKVLEWMFWEQYSHEPYVAVCRFQMKYQGKRADERDPDKVARGVNALETLENALADQPFLVGSELSAADIALVAYTRVAEEGGFDLSGFPHVRSWIGNCDTVLKLSE